MLNLSINPHQREFISHIELAELTGARQDNVKRRIKGLGKKGIISFTHCEEMIDIGKGGQRLVEVLLVNERDSYVIAAKLNDEFVAHVVDRWRETEAILKQMQRDSLPEGVPDFTNAIIAARAWADAIEAKAETETKLEEANAQIVALEPAARFVDAYVENGRNMNIRSVAKLLRANERAFVGFLEERRIMYRTYEKGPLKASKQEEKRGRLLTRITRNGFEQAFFTPAGVQWITQLWRDKDLPKLQSNLI